MTTNVPFLLRFATPFTRVRESDVPEGSDTSSTERNLVAESSLNNRGESRFTRVRNETTDDE
jgi:hypothetical protein